MQFPRFRGKTKTEKKKFNKEQRPNGHRANTYQQPGPRHWMDNRQPGVNNAVNSLQHLYRGIEGDESPNTNDLEWTRKQADFCLDKLDQARQHVENDLADRDAEGGANAGKRGLWFW